MSAGQNAPQDTRTRRLGLPSSLPDDVRALADRIPHVIRASLTPERAARLRPEMLARLKDEDVDMSLERLGDFHELHELFVPDTELRSLKLSTMGRLAAMSCRAFPQVCYSAYVPIRHRLAPTPRAPLILNVHGSTRDLTGNLARWVRFAEAHGCYVLNPLFPADLSTSEGDEAYKLLSHEGARSDLALLAMLEEFAGLNDVVFEPILFFGFSGGGQVGHRFLYLYPELLDAVSIGAPGMVTLLDQTRDWWVGIRDTESIFGRPIDVERVASVPVHVVVGAEDVEPLHFFSREQMGLTEDEYEVYGHTRVERARKLVAELRSVGTTVRHEEVAGIGHTAAPEILRRVEAFFLDVLGRA